jgi:D-galactarolactone isomerase
VRDPEPKPDDAILIDLMFDWAPAEAVRNRIFVENATKLYDFPKS